MKRLQLPKNKLAKLGINIIFVPIWYFLTEKLLAPIIDFLFFGITGIYGNDLFRNLYFLNLFIVLLMPIIIFTRYVWFGRIKLSPRITRSKD